MQKTIPALALLALLISACSRSAPLQPGEATPSPEASASEGLSASDETPAGFAAAVRNAEYQLSFSDQVRTVQLVDGRYQQDQREGADSFSVFMTDDIAVGDLDEDGVEEAVALVAENYGGTGSFTFLVVFQKQDGEPRFLTSIYLDKRPIIEALSIVGGEVRVKAILHTFDDPLCCPSISTERRYSLNGNNLVLRWLSTLAPTGQSRVIMIDSPTEGVTVSGAVQVTGRVSIAPFENTLVYRIYDMGNVELSAGPITVEAPDLGAPGTFQESISLGDIITNTTVRVEVQDINVADGSLFAMDSILLQVR